MMNKIFKRLIENAMYVVVIAIADYIFSGGK